jgi:nucleoside-diphosphate-sugar epimerase
MCGPDDAFLTTVVRLLRILPIYPMFGWGETRLQPVYVEDVAEGIARVLAGARGSIAPYELAGARVYTYKELVETTIMMWKTSFGDSLRSKTEIAMRNELYCKLICHNLSCLIKAMYELGLGTEFLAASFQKDAAD